MKIMSGKGKEYGVVSKETEATFQSWIEADGITVREFDELMKNESKEICVEQSKTSVTVSIYAGSEMVSCPFVWNVGGGIKQEAFWVDLLLLLTYIAGRIEDDKFLSEVKQIAQKYYRKR
jgi:hypothetical protein